MGILATEKAGPGVSPALLEMNAISKSFPGVQALKDVDFSLAPGEIVSLVGQNGAGKSTLVSIIGGIYTQDEGEIVIGGKRVRISNPGMAENLGIGLVHQEPTLVPNMTVAANIFLNREHLRNRILLDFKRMNKETVEVLKALGFELDPNRLVEDLRLVEKEVVEITKAMLLQPRILILDEVTAPLNAEEVEHLFQLVCELKAQGMAIIFISHRLTEVIQMSDRIVVLRDGCNAGELRREENPSEKDIIDLMLGGNEFTCEVDTCVADVRENDRLSIEQFTRHPFFQGVDLTLKAGEIVGLAGLKGSGITELMKSIYGTMKFDSGMVKVNGRVVDIRSPSNAIENGIGMLSNDRQKEGLALKRNVEENITISSLDALSNRFKFFRNRILKQKAMELSSALDIKTPSLKQNVNNLSGGNQQKVVMAKWLLRDLNYILIDEPTRGVDIKAKTEIHRLLVRLKQEGKGLLVSSPEVPELLNICDRILVFGGGRIAGEICRGTPRFNEARILESMHVESRAYTCTPGVAEAAAGG